MWKKLALAIGFCVGLSGIAQAADDVQPDSYTHCTNCGTSSTAPTFVTVQPTALTPTDKGGTMTTGGTSQTLAALNASRKFITIQNPCTAASQGLATTEDLYIAVTGAATVGGAGNHADLAPCGSTSILISGSVYTGAITVNATTTAHRWVATEWQ